jgi:hypothetical protein
MISSSLIIRTFLVAWRSGAGLRSDNSTDMKRPFCDFDVKKEATVDEKTAFIKGRVL